MMESTASQVLFRLRSIYTSSYLDLLHERQPTQDLADGPAMSQFSQFDPNGYESDAEGEEALRSMELEVPDLQAKEPILDGSHRHAAF